MTDKAPQDKSALLQSTSCSELKLKHSVLQSGVKSCNIYEPKQLCRPKRYQVMIAQAWVESPTKPSDCLCFHTAVKATVKGIVIPKTQRQKIVVIVKSKSIFVTVFSIDKKNRTNTIFTLLFIFFCIYSFWHSFDLITCIWSVSAVFKQQ